MNISSTDARALFTKQLVDVYQERIRPTSFLRSMFPTITAPTKEISIEVERGFERIAADVVRGTEGNRNTFSKSTEKIFVPPLFREYFDATQLDLYDRVLGSQGNANEGLFVALMNSVADRIGLLQDKIDRSYERQCAQVLETGIVTLKQGIANIDYKRKAASIVDLNADGGYWSTAANPFTQIEHGCTFLRTVGKSGDAVFNLILGSSSLAALLANSVFLTRQNLFNMALDQVQGPIRNGVGAAFHGIVTAGSYKVQLWSYPQYFDDPDNANASTPYIDAKLAILVPIAPRFKFSYAAVPQLIGQPGEMPKQGAYIVGQFVDERKAAHDFDIQSAGLAIPVAVDQIYTMQTLA